MYQRRPPNLEASTADLSERDIKENLVVKEEETNDTEVFEEVVVEVARFFYFYFCLGRPWVVVFLYFEATTRERRASELV